MAQSVVLRAAGLHTFKNQLSLIPEGAFEEALNVVIDRDGVVEPRRGFFQYSSTLPDVPKQVLNYKNRLLTHSDNVLSFESDTNTGLFEDFAGSYVEIESGRRIRGIETNGNFYFTTSEGVKKISALSASDFTTSAGYITQSGGIKALDVTASLDATTPGFLLPQSKVAYRVIWGVTDANDNLILGSPSSRVVVENPNPTDSAIVDLEFAIPEDIQDNTFYFYQVYRTGIVTSASLDTVDPGDEMNLVFEEFIEVGQTTINVQDITPEDFRRNGASLYTNPVSGEGIIQANEPPPFAKDIELYKGYTFYANTSTRQQVSISTLSVDNFDSTNTKIAVTDGTTTREYTFRGDFESYSIDYSGLVKADFYDVSVPGSEIGYYIAFASARDDILYKVWYTDTSLGAPPEEPTLAGSLAIEVDLNGVTDTPADIAQATINAIAAATNDFNFSVAAANWGIFCANNGAVSTATSNTIGAASIITKDGNGIGEDTATQFVFLPKIPGIGENGPTTSQQLDQAIRSLVKVINADTSGIVDAFYTSGFNDVPGQFLLQQRDLTGAQFSVYITDPVLNDDDLAKEFNPILGTLAAPNTLRSTNEVRGNRLYYSKFQQPEAVPLLNFLDVGPRDKEIQRIVALRDSLFIFKQDGIYRLSGDVAPFSIAPFDFSLTLQAPDTAVVLNNQVHAFTTQGVVQVTDTGVNVISRDIENILLRITSENFNTSTASFGVSYESDRSYLLFTVTNENDTTATQCFRYNSFTNTWVRWELTKTCGIVNTRDDKLYLGANDINQIEKERKNRNRTDYADRQFDNSIVSSGVNGNILQVSNTSLFEVGDAIIQTQYLTISQLNRVLNQLDRDPTVADTDYFSSLGASAGSNLRNIVNSLAIKLDSDTGVNDVDYASSLGGGATFPDIQSDFNIIVDKLNLDTGVFFANYDRSEGTVPVEDTVVEIPEDASSTVVVNFSFPFVEGEFIHYKSIPAEVIYAPQVMGNPTTHKQVSEGTYLFENNNFTAAEAGYKSDLSPFIENISFRGDGLGDWGQFLWGQNNWGGISGGKPLRTLVPLQKQRCRYIQPKFSHNVAFEKWSLYGISLEVREFSIRAYR